MSAINLSQDPDFCKLPKSMQIRMLKVMQMLEKTENIIDHDLIMGLNINKFHDQDQRIGKQSANATNCNDQKYPNDNADIDVGDKFNYSKRISKYSTACMNDPTLQLAKQWGAYPEYLFKEVQRLGLPTVKRAIDEVNAKGWVRSKSAYLSKCLANLDA